jgi:hypothetical protein
MGTIMIRFVGLLIVAVAVLALVWSRCFFRDSDSMVSDP